MAAIRILLLLPDSAASGSPKAAKDGAFATLPGSILETVAMEVSPLAGSASTIRFFFSAVEGGVGSFAGAGAVAEPACELPASAVGAERVGWDGALWAASEAVARIAGSLATTVWVRGEAMAR